MPCKCAAPGCKSTRNGKVSFHKVPKNPEYARIWIINSGRDDLLLKDEEEWQRNVFFCQLHFEDKAFNNPQNKKTIQRYAVPSIFSHGGPVMAISIPYKNRWCKI